MKQISLILLGGIVSTEKSVNCMKKSEKNFQPSGYLKLFKGTVVPICVLKKSGKM
jgi:hypothetical protein